MVTSGWRTKYMYGLGLTCRSDAVHVERIGVELEVEALGQHDLEDVAGEDVLLGHLDGAAVAVGAIDDGPGRAARRVGRLDQRCGRAARRAVGGHLVEPPVASS